MKARVQNIELLSVVVNQAFERNTIKVIGSEKIKLIISRCYKGKKEKLIMMGMSGKIIA